MKIKTIQSIDVQEWDALVQKTYGRIYSLQQQDGCKDRGLEHISIPDPHPYDCENDTVPEKVNGDEMGVSFAAWLARDPKQLLDTDNEWERSNGLDLFWRRNFYPTLDTVAQDLYVRGLLPAGEYQIVIDW